MVEGGQRDDEEEGGDCFVEGGLGRVLSGWNGSDGCFG